MPKISIALCTYNGERFLREQLESFLLQTRKPNELVIGDDCSTDNTVAIIDEFAAGAGFPVRVEVSDRNLGSTKNFEKTIQRCSGDLIFLADQDDVWLPKKIERIAAEFLRSERVGLVFTDAELVDDSMKPLNDRLWNYSFPPDRRARAETTAFYKTLLEGNVVTGATAAFRSEYVRHFVPVPDNFRNLIHDAWIALVISVNAEIAFINEPLVRYRQHIGQQLGVNWKLEVTGTIRERFNAALVIAKDQRQVLEEISMRLHLFPSLAAGGKIEAAVPANIFAVEGRIAHLENRLKIYNGEGPRLPLIATELRAGRYRRYSKGWLSAVKDLLFS